MKKGAVGMVRDMRGRAAGSKNTSGDHDDSSEDDENGVINVGERQARRCPRGVMHFKQSKYWRQLLSLSPSLLSSLLMVLRIYRKCFRVDSRASDKRLNFMLAALAV